MKRELTGYEKRMLLEMKLSPKAKEKIKIVWENNNAPKDSKSDLWGSLFLVIIVCIIFIDLILRVPVLAAIGVIWIWILHIGLPLFVIYNAIKLIPKINRTEDFHFLRFKLMLLWKGNSRAYNIFWWIGMAVLSVLLIYDDYLITGISAGIAWTGSSFVNSLLKRKIQKIINMIN